ncbi:type I-F CRISPR-associated endoribonuclease Cas6/Csy4 [Aliivibrio salmonicida]|uniref:type I-F CRISPR-associated endoribonuclease Cas6/Csy4 n=1 Tax=Aliivibrio salmonicida TaxID=40269 RepID=UPI00406D291B
MRENVLLNKVYTKLHKALVTLNSDSIGVSFPQYNVILEELFVFTVIVPCCMI